MNAKKQAELRGCEVIRVDSVDRVLAKTKAGVLVYVDSYGTMTQAPKQEAQR